MTFRIEIVPQCVESLDRLKEYALTCAEFPRLPKTEPHGGKIAIVGGSPSVANQLDELRAWDGEIWAINHTASWLKKQGIESTFITVDPQGPELFVTEGVTKAYLATCCHPKMREQFEEVHFFDLYETDPNGMTGGTTTVSRAMSLAINQGFYDITLYGCEGSFTIGKDHVDRNQGDKDMVIVRANGSDYITYLDYLLQTEHLATMIRLAPNVFKQKSGGLLEAMIKDFDEWAIVAVSASIKEHLEQRNGDHGIFQSNFPVNHLMSEAS